MVPPVLHFDVIGKIIDILFNDDTDGLQYVKKFSLVCHSFLPLCRKHIFSSISIKIGAVFEPHTSEGFGQLLLKNPGIARYIHELNVFIERRPAIDSKYFLEPVSRQLTRLQSLTISTPGRWYQGSWHQLSSSTQCSLLNLMHLPTLTHLNVKHISNFPKSNLIVWTNVKHLSLH